MDTDPEQKAALIVTRRPYRELSDGTLRVQIDVDPRDKPAFLLMFPDSGDPMVVARITDAAQREDLMNHVAPKGFGEEARILKQSGFFRSPDVWKAIGADSNFLAWLRQQRCVADVGMLPHEQKACGGMIVAAHVLRIANGAGKGIKPEYSAIPLCDKHHRLQHQHGESYVGGADHFDKQRIRHLQNWGWQRLKEQLGVESMTALEPGRLVAWAENKGVVEALPRAYREAAGL